MTIRGIEHQVTVAHSSFHNGAVERTHHSIEEEIRCLLVDGSLPPSLWTEFVSTAVYLFNRTPVPSKKNAILLACETTETL